MAKNQIQGPNGGTLDPNSDGSINIKTEEGTPLEVSQKGSKATDAVAVTPDDANDLATTPTSALQVGGSGDVKVDMEDGTTIVLPSLTAGVVYPYSITRVYATDTTATNVIALY